MNVPVRRSRDSFVAHPHVLAGLVLIALSQLTTPSLAQSGGQSGSKDSSAARSVLDLPFVGEIDLPDWLSFLGSSSSEGSGSGSGKGSGQGQAPAVVVTPAKLHSVGEQFEFIGKIEAIENVTLQARVNGFIEKVFFQGGDVVHTGERLFKIEDDQYEAALAAAKARLSGAEAQLSEAQRSLSRAQELIDSGTIPQSQLDDARATFQSAKATREQAQASVRQAELNLDYTSIEAPIDGVISEALITKGNFVSAASGTLANIVQINPIWGTFPISENRIGTWRRVSPGGESEAAASANDYRLTLKLPSDERFEGEGEFAFVGNTVDPTTGTVSVRIRFKNPDGRLLPNENVTLVASERNPPQEPVVPQAAIQLNREGSYVFVYDPQTKTVHQQPVETGKNMTGDVAITSGLKAGELIVTQGLQNISDGQSVTANRESRTKAPGGPLRDQGGSGSASEAGTSSNGGKGGSGAGPGASDGSSSQNGSETKTASSGSSANQQDSGQ